MKQGSNNRRSRSRGGGGGKRHSGGGGRNSFESNGPDVKIRGTAQQVQEKYLSLARDATSSGDWVSAEAYYQFAEHYYRVIISDVQKQNQNKGQSQGQGQNKGPVDHNVRDQHSPVAAQEKPAPQADQKPEPKPEPKPDSKGDVADASAATPIAAEEKPAFQADRKPAPKPAPKTKPKSGPKPVSKGNAAGASPATLAAAVAERESAESKNASEPKPDPVPEKAAS